MTHLPVPHKSAAVRPSAAGLFGDFDRLFDELWRGFGGPLSRGATSSALAPRMDYSVTDDAIRLRAEMPGLEEKDIEVSLEGGVLTIKGERSEERKEEDEEKGYHHLETFRGSFRRALRLPAGVDEDAVTASYKSGILSVTLPKLAEATPDVRSIPVTVS